MGNLITCISYYSSPTHCCGEWKCLPPQGNCPCVLYCLCVVRKRAFTSGRGSGHVGPPVSIRGVRGMA